MTTTITGLYPDKAAADVAVSRLIAAGFASNTISVILSGTPHHEELVRAETEDAPRGMLSGAIAGGAFASILVGALSLPGIGLLAAGPWLGALLAGGAGAAAGGVLGGFVGHGLSLQVAQEYETALTRGGVVLGVHTVYGQAAKVRSILRDTGADHISDSVHFGKPRELTEMGG
jgi:hypothetical protein